METSECGKPNQYKHLSVILSLTVPSMNKKAFQSNANRPPTDNTGYIANNYEHVRGAAWAGVLYRSGVGRGPIQRPHLCTDRQTDRQGLKHYLPATLSGDSNNRHVFRNVSDPVVSICG